VLTGLAPGVSTVAAATSPPAGRVTAAGNDYATTVRVKLTMTPGTAGRNAYLLRVGDYDNGEPVTGVTGSRMECSVPARPSPERGRSPSTSRRRPGGVVVPLELTIPAPGSP
jgi:hypothetical protein